MFTGNNKCLNIINAEWLSHLLTVHDVYCECRAQLEPHSLTENGSTKEDLQVPSSGVGNVTPIVISYNINGFQYKIYKNYPASERNEGQLTSVKIKNKPDSFSDTQDFVSLTNLVNVAIDHEYAKKAVESGDLSQLHGVNALSRRDTRKEFDQTDLHFPTLSDGELMLCKKKRHRRKKRLRHGTKHSMKRSTSYILSEHGHIELMTDDQHGLGFNDTFVYDDRNGGVEVERVAVNGRNDDLRDGNEKYDRSISTERAILSAENTRESAYIEPKPIKSERTFGAELENTNFSNTDPFRGYVLNGLINAKVPGFAETTIHDVNHDYDLSRNDSTTSVNEAVDNFVDDFGQNSLKNGENETKSWDDRSVGEVTDSLTNNAILHTQPSERDVDEDNNVKVTLSQDREDTGQNDAHGSFTDRNTNKQQPKVSPKTSRVRDIPASCVYKCKHCSFKARRLLNIKRHILKHLAEQANSPPVEQEQTNSLPVEQANSPPTELANSPITKPWAACADDHITAVTTDPNEETIVTLADGLFGCGLCEYSSKKLYNVQRHLDTHGMQTQSEPAGITRLLLRQLVTRPDAGYHCGQCPYATTSLYNFRRHTRGHNPESKIGCGQCDRSYSDQYKLKRHVRSAHKTSEAGFLPHLCNVCHQSFKTPDLLSCHFTKVHAVISNDKSDIASNDDFGIAPNADSGVAPNTIHVVKKENLQSATENSARGNLPSARLDGYFSGVLLDAVNIDEHDTCKTTDGNATGDNNADISGRTSKLLPHQSDRLDTQSVLIYDADCILVDSPNKLDVYGLLNDAPSFGDNDLKFDESGKSPANVRETSSFMVKWENDYFPFSDFDSAGNYSRSISQYKSPRCNSLPDHGRNIESDDERGKVDASIKKEFRTKAKDVNPLRRYCVCGRSYRWRSSLAWHRKICKQSLDTCKNSQK